MHSPSWQPALLLNNEAEKLAVLKNDQVIDTTPEAVFDRLVRLAAQRFDVPIALVSLIEGKQQWYKSRHGISASTASRDITFCAHAILQNDTYIVPDTIKDPHYVNNPLVTGDPHIRFYAGTPLTTKGGVKLGTVCIVDHKPHPDFAEEQKKELIELASIAMDEMELRLSVKRAREDLEALKKAQVELEIARREAERATQEKSRFVATISHELRTPMNGILGMVYLLQDSKLDSVQHEYIETINHSAKNLLLLINDVLDLSKIEAGELIIEKKAFNVKNSFYQTTRLLKSLAEKRGNTLNVVIDPLIPQYIVGDPGRFAQIVTNLVGNAVKFTEKGRVDAHIRRTQNGSQLRCDIIDTGIGIPVNKQEHIYEQFTQGNAEITEKYGGTGLGLAITKRLIEMLGGEIGFTSATDKGTHFWFTLQLEEASSNNVAAMDVIDTPSMQNLIQVETASVLIAEDHPVNHVFLEALLKKYGFQKIDIAENGSSAVNALRARLDEKKVPYDIVFMDCKMPEMDGYEATRQMRALETKYTPTSHIPIVAMTANALAGDREQCFMAGMDDYITKPLQPDRLKESLTRWFSFPAISSLSPVSDKTIPLQEPIDISRIALVADTDIEKAKLLYMFFSMAGQIIDVMENSRRAEEMGKWKDAAHNLKGTAANMGMPQLEDICRHAEKSTDYSYGGRSAHLSAIKNELERIRQYIQSHTPHLLSTEVT